MKYRCLSVVLTAAVLLLSAGLSSAIENKTDTPQQAATRVDASPKNTKSEIDARHKHPARIKLVDINSATKEELKKLPGIGDAEADKIIAGRPFGSKAWLGTNNVIPMATYQAVKELIICNITKKDFDRITAQAAHKNKKQ
jgi:DNA uptake protein ComE-like DNA-binding protein